MQCEWHCTDRGRGVEHFESVAACGVDHELSCSDRTQCGQLLDDGRQNPVGYCHENQVRVSTNLGGIHDRYTGQQRIRTKARCIRTRCHSQYPMTCTVPCSSEHGTNAATSDDRYTQTRRTYVAHRTRA